MATTQRTVKEEVRLDLAAIILHTAGSREAIEDAVARLIEVLDWIDSDADLEDADPTEEEGDLEPSLGWTHSSVQLTPEYAVDLEDDHDGCETDYYE